MKKRRNGRKSYLIIFPQKFPELKFKYVEEESPEDFFVPYVWRLVGEKVIRTIQVVRQPLTRPLLPPGLLQSIVRQTDDEPQLSRPKWKTRVVHLLTNEVEEEDARELFYTKICILAPLELSCC